MSSRRASRSIPLTTPPDVLILGGGIIAQAIALELSQRGASVQVLCRRSQEAAGYVAAGMLAPQAELLPRGVLREMAVASRDRYPDWIPRIEQLSGLSTGYWRCGILRPVYGDEPTPTVEIDAQTPAEWLDRSALEALQPGLSPEVRGGWWFPEDAQVDNRRALLRSLRAALVRAGVDWQEGVTAQALVTSGDGVQAIATNRGQYSAGQYIWAAGAWSRDLLELPVCPRKGQMLSVQTPSGETPLGRVLFGEGVYIVPRRDGLVVIGATSESVGFRDGVTAGGLQQLLQGALRLYPAFAAYPLQETWWGYRPETPDGLPILGGSCYANLAIATGHYRNGILLSPITADLMADWILERRSHPWLEACSVNRAEPTSIKKCQ